MAHRNARLTPVTRAELVERVTDGWPQAEVARLFRVSRATVAKWVRRFREGGPDALYDRSSRPLRSPRRPVSCRKQPSALHAGLSPGGHTASGGGWASPAPPSTPSCAAPDSTASRGSIAPHGRSCATSMPARARWFTSTSRNSVASRRVAASASCPASPRPTAVLSAAPASVSISSMWPWTTIPATPTSRPCRTNAARLLLPSSSGRWPTSGARASPSSAS